MEKKIGKRIEIAREYRKISRTNLGKAVGFPEASAYRRVLSYEKGERIPKEDMLKEFAEALKIDIAWFNLDEDLYMDHPSLFVHGANTRRIKARLKIEKGIYNNLYLLTDDELQEIINMIQKKGGILCKKMLNRER